MLWVIVTWPKFICVLFYRCPIQKSHYNCKIIIINNYVTYSSHLNFFFLSKVIWNLLSSCCNRMTLFWAGDQNYIKTWPELFATFYQRLFNKKVHIFFLFYQWPWLFKPFIVKRFGYTVLEFLRIVFKN